MNRRIIALALAAAAVACKEQPRRNADGSPALSYAAQDSLLKIKDSLIAEKTRQLSEQSAIIGDAATIVLPRPNISFVPPSYFIRPRLIRSFSEPIATKTESSRADISVVRAMSTVFALVRLSTR